MKIKIAKNLYVNSNTLFRLEWRQWYPALVIHEKFEKVVKWILRIIALLGIATSVITINQWYISLFVTILIFLIEQFFERTVIEYTAIVFQPPPDFKIEYGQWKTNAFRIPPEKKENELAHFGPSYDNEEYAIKFFKYLRTWVNDSNNDDLENTLVISLVIEPDETYTTYIYANLGRKRLDYMFWLIDKVNKLEKYGKRQQSMIAQNFYWNTLDFKDGYFIKKFLAFQKADTPFYFTPSVIQPFGLPPKFLVDYSIKKYRLKVCKRQEVKKNSPEFHFNPAKRKPISHSEIEIKKTKANDTFDDIQIAFSKAVDVGFMPNNKNSAGAINLCFLDTLVPFAAYENLIELAKNKEVLITIKDNQVTIDLNIEISSLTKKITLKNLVYNIAEFEKFKKVNGGGSHIVLLIGDPPANEKKVILKNDMSPLIVKWAIE